ncbi:MAG: hypothetical protein ACRD1M_09315 [Terriglobales bacterium]
MAISAQLAGSGVVAIRGEVQLPLPESAVSTPEPACCTKVESPLLKLIQVPLLLFSVAVMLQPSLTPTVCLAR